MQRTKYLYNIDPHELASMNYLEAIEYKLTSAKQLIADLYEIRMDSRDEDRIFKVHKAINFNKELLKELK